MNRNDLIKKLEELKMELVDINKVIPDPHNPKIHPDEQIDKIVNNIQLVGWTNPMILDEEFVIIAGHGRLLAAKKLGLTKVPCIICRGLSRAEIISQRIFDNRSAEDSLWDIEQVALNLQELKELGADLSMTGMNDDEISDFLDKMGNLQENDATVDNADTDIPEELPEVPQTNVGDIWTFGNHKLICGDSLQTATYNSLLGQEQVDLLLTDPPYNVNVENAEGQKILNDNMDNTDFSDFVKSFANKVIQYLKSGAAFYVWHADNISIPFRIAFSKNGWSLKATLIWVKNNFTLGRQDYQWQHEPCLYGWKNGGKHFFIEDRNKSTVLFYDKPKVSTLHPTMKPVSLFSELIINSTLRDAIVLDTFGGSGTTIIACERLGRKARVIELDPKYCDVIIRRYLELFGGIAVNQDGKEFVL